jgi:hypothetical protein
MRAAPPPGQPSEPIFVAYLALAREAQNMEQDLAKSMGPDDAKRIVFAEQGCWWNSSHGVGPRGEQ